jgi:hypothetical protein
MLGNFVESTAPYTGRSTSGVGHRQNISNRPNVAVEIASKMPQAGAGLIVVRPIVEFEPGNISSKAQFHLVL